MNPANHCRHAVEWSGVRREWFSMPYEDADQKRFIWGVTAGILRNLYCFLSTDPDQAGSSAESWLSCRHEFFRTFICFLARTSSAIEFWWKPGANLASLVWQGKQHARHRWPTPCLDRLGLGHRLALLAGVGGSFCFGIPSPIIFLRPSLTWRGIPSLTSNTNNLPSNVLIWYIIH